MNPQPIDCTVFLCVAFVLAGVAQTLWLKSRYAATWRIPLDGGMRFRQRRFFGDNKTLSGFVVMVPACGLAFWLVNGLLQLNHGSPNIPWEISGLSYLLLGAWAGFGFMVGELPNSFFKRQLEIGPGKAPANPVMATACFAVDQVDSIVGALLALSLVVPVPLACWLALLLIGAGVHWLFNLLFMAIGLKTRAA